MSGRERCCVGGCNATRDSHRLFCFPKIDYLRNLWVSFIVPTNPRLIGLSKDQLIQKRVCEKHFDKYQFDHEGKRLRYSYPCLLTDQEIALGEPLATPRADNDLMSDHNYCKEQNDDEDNMKDAEMVVLKLGDDFNENSYCSENITTTTGLKDGLSSPPTCSTLQQNDQITEFEHTDENTEFENITSTMEAVADTYYAGYIDDEIVHMQDAAYCYTANMTKGFLEEVVIETI